MKFSILKFKPKVNQKLIETKGLECLNCGQPFTGNENFCSFCGQKNTIKKLNFGYFINNLISGFFSYDSRFWNTFIPLLTKPGKVSKEYIEGKRARFVNPFQLYLNISIIFFLIVGLTINSDKNKNSVNNIIAATKNLDSISQKEKKQLDSILTNVKEEIIKANPNDSSKVKVATDLGSVFRLINEDEKSEKEYAYHIKNDTIKNIGIVNKINDLYHFNDKFPNYNNEQALDSLGYEKTFWNTFYYQEVINITKNIKQVQSDGGKSYFKKLTSYISISLFIFLPIFTLFLKAVYFRRKFTYMEHLVFVFHTQTVFFLLFVIFYLLNLFVELESYSWVLVILFLLYLYKALRYFYKQKRFKTILKFMLLNSFYLFLGIIGFTIVSILSFAVG
ncbi:DUF3667 domain-containing protein [uncultured Lutibacter sp.]|uniref:DUF3667 domain-containing protein n=1 Tax=uncultured Lutibacter sp. TaxID=437739 RepID=UPI00262A4A3C|nr:DUF3667 domain-containing protein [uncultured Lutibacter sp.]